MSRTRIFCGVISLVLAVAGCESKPKSNYERLNLVNAGGTIMLDGQPLPNAVISFDDPADDTFAYGMTDSTGKYRLQIDSEMKGVRPGAKVVRISTTRKILGLNVNEDSDTSNKSVAPTEQVPERYNKKSKLFVEVVTSKTNYDFSLDSK